VNDQRAFEIAGDQRHVTLFDGRARGSGIPSHRTYRQHELLTQCSQLIGIYTTVVVYARDASRCPRIFVIIHELMFLVLLDTPDVVAEVEKDALAGGRVPL
jgi:hypothetical protein